MTKTGTWMNSGTAGPPPDEYESGRVLTKTTKVSPTMDKRPKLDKVTSLEIIESSRSYNVSSSSHQTHFIDPTGPGIPPGVGGTKRQHLSHMGASTSSYIPPRSTTHTPLGATRKLLEAQRPVLQTGREIHSSLGGVSSAQRREIHISSLEYSKESQIHDKEIHVFTSDSGREIHSSAGSHGRELHIIGSDHGREIHLLGNEHAIGVDHGREIHISGSDHIREIKMPEIEHGREIHLPGSDHVKEIHISGGDHVRELYRQQSQERSSGGSRDSHDDSMSHRSRTASDSGYQGSCHGGFSYSSSQHSQFYDSPIMDFKTIRSPDIRIDRDRGYHSCPPYGDGMSPLEGGSSSSMISYDGTIHHLNPSLSSDPVIRNDSLSSDQSEGVRHPPPRPHKSRKGRPTPQRSISSSDDEIQSTPDCTSCEDDASSERGESFTLFV